MQLQWTIASLCQPTHTMTIQREYEIAHLLREYERQQESSDLPDRTLLSQARVLVEQKVHGGPLDHELIELANNLYRSLGTWEDLMIFLRQYLQHELDTTTRAWAWWHLVDCLALCEHDQETIKEQEALLQWAKHHLPLDGCFFVMADETQANCWYRAGQDNRWFALYASVAEHAAKTAHNRLDRFYCLRTAAHQCLRRGDLTQARALLSKLHALEREDPTMWAEHHWIKVEISILNIEITDKSGDTTLVRTLARSAMKELEEWERQLNVHDPEAVKRFRSLSHNIAAPLYRGKHYDLAIPLFQQAVKYHTNPHYAYLWLAASLWKTTHQREHVFPYLYQATARYDGAGKPWEQFRKLPEFQDVKNDQEFQAVVEGAKKV